MTDHEFTSQRPWLKSYDAEVPPSLDYDDIPIFELLDRAADKHPKRTAIVFKNWKINYAKLRSQCETIAANLRAHGVSRRDRVSIMLPNLPSTVMAYFGVLKAGAIGVMTNPLYMEKELIHQIQDSGAKYMIVLDHLWPKIRRLRDRLGIKKFFVVRISDSLRFPLNRLYKLKAKKNKLNLDAPFDGETVFPFTDLLKLKNGLKPFSVSITNPREEIALLQYTGGTTGIAKGVMLTHYNLCANVKQCSAMLHALGRKGRQERFMGVLPYFHVYGLTVCMNLPVALAGTLQPLPRFDPKDLLETIHKLKPTVLPGAPSIYIALLQQKKLAKYNLSSIDYCVSGSSPIPVETIKAFKEKANAEIVEGFGLTEASPVTHLNPLSGARKYGSIGLPFPDVDAQVVDMEVGTIPLPPGKVGELVLRGPQVMMGYWNRPDATASTIRNEWLYTGDIAYMDEDGYFYIVDRKKDMVIVGGYNVYPREIDEVLYEHPKVKEAVAVGVPHPSRGEIIKAYIVPKDGETLTRGEIVAHCREKLANYKVPRKVEFRDELPKTIVGKVLRRALLAEEQEKVSHPALKREQEKAAEAENSEADDLPEQDGGSQDESTDS